MGPFRRGTLALWAAAAQPRSASQRSVYGESAAGARGALAGRHCRHAGVRSIRLATMRRTAHSRDGRYARPAPQRYAAVSARGTPAVGRSAVLVWGAEDTVVPERLFHDYEQRARAGHDSLEVIVLAGSRITICVCPRVPVGSRSRPRFAGSSADAIPFSRILS